MREKRGSPEECSGGCGRDYIQNVRGPWGMILSRKKRLEQGRLKRIVIQEDIQDPRCPRYMNTQGSDSNRGAHEWG